MLTMNHGRAASRKGHSCSGKYSNRAAVFMRQHRAEGLSMDVVVYQSEHVRAILTTEPVSLLPVDVGFDLKVTGPSVRLSSLFVKYLDSDGQTQQVAGDPETVAIALARAGYQVVAGTMPNGRELRCEPDGPGQHRFAVQPANDNYWCEGLTIDAVLADAGWSGQDVTFLSDPAADVPFQPKPAADPVDPDDLLHRLDGFDVTYSGHVASGLVKQAHDFADQCAASLAPRHLDLPEAPTRGQIVEAIQGAVEKIWLRRFGKATGADTFCFAPNFRGGPDPADPTKQE